MHQTKQNIVLGFRNKLKWSNKRQVGIKQSKKFVLSRSKLIGTLIVVTKLASFRVAFETIKEKTFIYCKNSIKAAKL